MSADNTNTNFWGLNRQGKTNLFHKLNSSCSKSIVGVVCIAHILNNCIWNSTDIEIIVVKIYKHFDIYTVWVDNLKTFGDDIKIEYKIILSFSKTRILSLIPAIEEVLQTYEP